MIFQILLEEFYFFLITSFPLKKHLIIFQIYIYYELLKLYKKMFKKNQVPLYIYIKKIILFLYRQISYCYLFHKKYLNNKYIYI